MYYHYRPENITHARNLRKEMTPEERHLWYDFLKSYPVKFYKQRRIEQYIVDFYCRQARLVIEIDGGQHYEKEALQYDEQRSRLLERCGLYVMRFTNLDLQRNFQEVCQVIHEYIRSGIDIRT
ncbi:endonuclease domain-containing protein [Megasphaera sueciensis]|uniref:endonuclease domain-containing protein n=1 Tax=Megasphaera sueciensis TaxID=349094 RepID=UPI003CFFC728